MGRELTLEQSQARAAVSWSIRNGKLPPASERTCDECGAQAAHYHHHKGYELAYQLDVQPLCRSCHTILHNGPSSRPGHHRPRRGKVTCDQTMEWIKAFHQERGIAPTVREIMEGLGYSSTSVVSYRLQQLVRMGRINHQSMIPRSIVVLASPTAADPAPDGAHQEER